MSEIEELPADRNDATHIKVLRAPFNTLPVVGRPFALSDRLQDHRIAFLADRHFLSFEAELATAIGRLANARLVKSFARAFAGVSDRAARRIKPVLDRGRLLLHGVSPCNVEAIGPRSDAPK